MNCLIPFELHIAFHSFANYQRVQTLMGAADLTSTAEILLVAVETQSPGLNDEAFCLELASYGANTVQVRSFVNEYVSQDIYVNGLCCGRFDDSMPTSYVLLKRGRRLSEGEKEEVLQEACRVGPQGVTGQRWRSPLFVNSVCLYVPTTALPWFRGNPNLSQTFSILPRRLGQEDGNLGFQDGLHLCGTLVKAPVLSTNTSLFSGVGGDIEHDHSPKSVPDEDASPFCARTHSASVASKAGGRRRAPRHERARLFTAVKGTATS
ncbi:hypothetical protein BC830DRAFT_1079213 [Chytriomyces sp. MP71]|nr:hypothetical protein BC830DRAFT_1079213 [Chytriomyces sp. MP71]